jgi:hypothetical protein
MTFRSPPSLKEKPFAIVTDPINEKAKSFYESFGFVALESGRCSSPWKQSRLTSFEQQTRLPFTMGKMLY